MARGVTRAELSTAWRSGVLEAAAADGVAITGLWDFTSVGTDPWSLEGIVEPGSIIKIDARVVIGGYSSDTARSYSFRQPDPLAADIHAILAEGFAAGLATIRPGAALSDIYEATAAVIYRAGLRSYQRGHYGHGLGASVGSEEWPFIAADSDAIVEPGMVLVFETPFYGKGIGSLTIEDQLVVTETGIDVVTRLPRELVRID